MSIYCHGCRSLADDLATIKAENATLTAACAAWRDKAERAEAALADAVEHAHGMGQQDAAKRAERAEANWEGTAAEARRLLAENNGLHAALARAREVLREVEFEGEHMGRACCPMCGGLVVYTEPFKHEFTLKDDHFGHRPDCALKAALGKGGEP